MSAPRLSVIIATKDRAAFLDAALESLCRQVGAPEFEVIVVDNGGSDETPAVIERWSTELPVRGLREERANRGLARNHGIAAAQGEIVAFCDDDVVHPADWLAAHARAHDAGGAALAVTGPIINVPSHDDRPLPVPRNFSRAFFCTCNVSVPLEALRRVGGFDESFDLYGWEDTELGARLRDAGVQRRFAWDAYLWHIKPPTVETLEVQLRRAAEKGRMAARYVRKRPSHDAVLATGAYALNRWKGRLLSPAPVRAFLAGVLDAGHVPKALERAARAQLLDGIYLSEMERELRSAR
ncbi:MAG TPA: glycosyltransferase family A protein [Candidatus Dormibacteraeota bacterium]|nr:glycosyltransferase family A protein [Candidatus Dormibacteraeota bacterium]